MFMVGCGVGGWEQWGRGRGTLHGEPVASQYPRDPRGRGNGAHLPALAWPVPLPSSPLLKYWEHCGQWEAAVPPMPACPGAGCLHRAICPCSPSGGGHRAEGTQDKEMSWTMQTFQV